MASTTGLRGFRLAVGFDPVELSEQRCGYLLDAPCLMGGEVLPPSSRVGLTVEFAPPFLILGNVLRRAFSLLAPAPPRPSESPVQSKYPSWSRECPPSGPHSGPLP